MMLNEKQYCKFKLKVTAPREIEKEDEIALYRRLSRKAFYRVVCLEKAFYHRTITRRPKITQQTKYKSIKFKST